MFECQWLNKVSLCGSRVNCWSNNGSSNVVTTAAAT